MIHHFYPHTEFCSGVCIYTEEFACLFEYLWSSFKSSQGTMVCSYLWEVQQYPPLEWGMVRGMELHPKGTGKTQVRLLHHYIWNWILWSCLSSWVVCPLKLEVLLEYFSKMLQPRVDVYRLAGRACRHRPTSVLWCVLRSICPAGPYCVYRSM